MKIAASYIIKSATVAEKTDLWGNFIIAILTRTGLHSFSHCQAENSYSVLDFVTITREFLLPGSSGSSRSILG